MTPRIACSYPEAPRRSDRRSGERGIVLLLALVALLLIAAVGATILYMSSTESSLVGNQRLATQAFFAAEAGAEEAEWRMLAASTSPTPELLFGSAAPLPTAVGGVIYIINPGPGEIVDPKAAGTAFFDTEYEQEFGVPPPAGAVLVPSNLPPPAGMPPIGYKWVRVTLKTEWAARADINGLPDGPGGSLYNDVIGVCHDGKREFVPVPPLPPPPASQCPLLPSGAGQPVYRLTSLAVLSIGTRAMVQREIGAAQYPALVVDGNLRLNGNPTIDGDAGAVHANGDLDLNGNPCAEEYFSSSGETTAGGGPQGGPGCTPGGVDIQEGQEELPIPTLDPANYRPGATGPANTPPPGGDSRCAALPCFLFLGNGDVWRVDAASSTFVGSGSDPMTGWKQDKPAGDPAGPAWGTTQDSVPNGTYYFEGNLVISSNVGSGPAGAPQCQAPFTCPAQVTFVSEGNVEVGGNPSVAPAGGMKIGNGPITIFAGDDLKLNGNPGAGVAGYSGMFYAGDQIDFSGTPEIMGQVLADNQDDVPTHGNQNLVPLQAGGYMGVSGNAHITYDGGFGATGMRPIAWREVRPIP